MKSLQAIIPLLLLLIVSQWLVVNCQRIGELDLIDYDTQISTNELDFFKKKHVVLVFLQENSPDRETYQTLFNQLKKQLDELNESTSQQQIQIYGIISQTYAEKFGIYNYPQLLYFRDGNYVKFSGSKTVENLFKWIEETIEKKTHILDDSSFEHDTQASTGATTGDWLVLFHKKNCHTKTLIESNWEMASLKLENQVNLAYVDLDSSPDLQKRFYIYNSPSIIFFRQGFMYRYELAKYDVDSIVSFTTNGFYRNVKGEKVPKEMVWFDQFTDEIVIYLKKMDKRKAYGLICILGVVCILIWVWTLTKFERKTENFQEDKNEKGQKQF